MQPNQNCYSPAIKNGVVNAFNSTVRAAFILKYCERLRDTYLYMQHIFELTDGDLDVFLKGDPKPNCNHCQYCCLLAFCNIVGGYMPPTPSPYFTPVPKWPECGTNAVSHTSVTERQYNNLYRDFNHASLIELRSKLTSGDRIEELGVPADDKILQVIHSFTSEIFSLLLDEYMKLFEEMFKGIVLFNESGITLEDICSGEENGDANNCQQANCSRNMYSDNSSRKPYEMAEFEKQLLDELIKQFESLQESDHNANHNANNRESQACDCRHTTKRDNAYLAYLTQIKPYSPSRHDTESLAETLQAEKKMYLKSCLMLLRDKRYFRSPVQSCSETEYFCDHEYEEASSVNCRRQVDFSDDELLDISVAIYNQTVWHVQSTIFAIFKSLQNNELYTRRILPNTPRKTELKKQTKKYIPTSKSCYSKETDLSATEDEVFTSTGQDDLNKTLNHDECDVEIPALPSINHKEEMKYRHEQHQYSQLSPDLRVRRFQQEIMLQHPDLEYVEDAMRQTNNSTHSRHAKAETGFPYSVDKNNLSRLNSEQRNTAEKPENTTIIEDKTVFLQPNLQERGKGLFNRTLFKGKTSQARVICIFNYYKPEVSHIDAVAFIEKIKREGGVLHYPHCSENASLTKIEGPSFYFTECCVDCRQELAPPQKLEAFKAEPKHNNKCNIISQFLRKTRASIYFPVQCGSCSYYVRDPHKAKQHHLFVPFHSAVKGRICSSRLKSHKCEFVLSAKEYTGCRSDTINNSNAQTQRLSRDHVNKSQNHKYIYRSRSLPLLEHQKDYESRGILANDNEARKKASLKFEDAVANILNIWTYEMINYEKGVDSPHIRSQIMNYRKSISVFIKKDLKEKLCYRHILSVFKRVENYESPILEFKDRDSTQKNMLNYKIIKKSHSVLEAIQRSNNVSFEYNNNISSLKKIDQCIEKRQHVNGEENLRSAGLHRKNIVTPLSLHSQPERKPSNTQRRRCYSFSESLYKDDFSSQMNAWKNELKELQKSIESPDFRSETRNRKNIVRPVSLRSEIKHKTFTAPHRRRRSSCSFATERYKDFSTPITAWKDELLNLQKNAESPSLKSETRKNTARPLSLHTELNKKPQTTKRRRSYSLAESNFKEDYSSYMNAWKNELLKLQNSAQSPHLRALSMNRKNLVRPLSLHSDLEQRTPGSQRRRSCSYTESACKEAVSTQMSAWERELKALQKSVDSPNLRFGAIDFNNKVGSLHPKPKRKNTAEAHRPKSESFINEFSSQINKSKLELLKLQKSFEVQHLRPEIIHRNNIIKAASLHSEPRLKAAAPRRPQSDSVINKEASSELNEWRIKLLKLQKSVDSPQSKSETARRKIIASSCSEPKQSADVAANCPKSELDDTLTELKTWNLKLRELERDAIRPLSPYLRPKQIKRKIKTRAVSLNTEPKRTTTFTTIRPKSESVLDDYSTELETWKHELLTLEEDAQNPQHETLIPQHETLTCKSIAKSRSMHSELKYKKIAPGFSFESTLTYNKDDTSRIKPRMLPLELDLKNKTSTQYISPVRRYSATPRQLPAIPTQRNMRRHSHYETTGNFVNLLSNKKATHLNTHARNSVSPNVPNTDAIHRNEASERYLRPEEIVSRSRFYSH